ncbi:hypothetical protein F7725_013800 [Dissostichus mawsoni]|uniref:C2 domain-containing protein n=1 Tax=Dissostichus mawsoni TaxID=36200 RepID=A0A7J5YU24_DISMA|nr:hypothetical protein F7725_013800 [Dissostichus mawsoni]
MEDEEESRTRRSRSKPSKSIVKDAVSDDKIFQSDIKKQTLNPIWNQTFILDKDEAVSLTQKLEDIKSNFNSLRRILVQICKTQAFQKLNPAEFELHDEVSDAILDLPEIVSALSRLIAEVQEDIKHNKDAWNRVFVSAVQVDVFTVVYKAFDYLLAKEMRDTLSLIEGQMEQTLANNLFPVYLSLQNIQQDKAFLQKSCRHP